MNLRSRLLLFVALLPAAMTGHAQLFSVYGTAALTHVSGVQTSSAGTTAGASSANFGGGVTVNFLSLHVVKLGLDARGSAGSGTHKTDNAEFSFRLGFQPPVINLKPFAQAGIGYAQSTVAITSGVGTETSRKYVTFGGHAGVDKPIFPFIDWRVVDVGYAHGVDVGPSFNNENVAHANFFSVGTGLVAHF